MSLTIEVYDRNKIGPRDGMNDVVVDGKLVRGTPAASVLVRSEEDLEDLPEYPAGTMAYTAGFKAMWQLSAGGEWVKMI